MLPFQYLVIVAVVLLFSGNRGHDSRVSPDENSRRINALLLVLPVLLKHASTTLTRTFPGGRLCITVEIYLVAVEPERVCMGNWNSTIGCQYCKVIKLYSIGWTSIVSIKYLMSVITDVSDPGSSLAWSN